MKGNGKLNHYHMNGMGAKSVKVLELLQGRADKGTAQQLVPFCKTLGIVDTSNK